MKITKMDKKAAGVLHTALNEAMKKFAEQYGLEFKGANSQFSDVGTFRMPLEFIIAGDEAERKRSDMYAEAHGYEVRFGDTVKCNGMDSKVVAVTKRGAVTVLASNGTRYSMNSPELLKPLNKPEPAAPALPKEGTIRVLVDGKAMDAELVDHPELPGEDKPDVTYRNPKHGHLCSASWRLMFIREALDLSGGVILAKVCRMVGMPGEYDWSFIRDADSAVLTEVANTLYISVGEKMKRLGLTSVTKFRSSVNA